MGAKKSKRKSREHLGPASAAVRLQVQELMNVLAPPPESFMIKRPPADAWIEEFPDRLPGLYVPVLDETILPITAHLRELQKVYRKTKNGMYLISAFLIAHASGFYPPLWVLNSLGSILKQYWRTPYWDSLDELMGLRAGKGQFPGPKRAVLRARNWSIATDMWLLIHKFGCSIDEAADMALQKLERLNETSQPTRWGKKVPTTLKHESVVKLYTNKWRDDFGLTQYSYQLLSRLYSEEDWRAFLKTFPLSSCLPDLQAKLRLK